MRQNLKTQKPTNGGPGFNIILLLVASITLIYSNSGFDPINVPKQIVLYVGAAWLIGALVFKSRNKLFVRLFKVNFNLEIVLLIFVLFQFISALVSEDRLVGIIGENQRKNGALTYLALSIVFFYTIRCFAKFNYQKFAQFSIFLGFILSSYGILQITGNDFESWVNPYNPVILTVGNPNFASALLAILGVLLFSFLFVQYISTTTKLAGGFVLLMVAYVIFVSESLQGLVILVLGNALVFGCVIALNQKTRRLSFVYFPILAIFSIVGMLGMLQIGPMQSILYKGSVSVRGYYWRAAWNMFAENPIFGVGTDQYGSYFRMYREPGYSLAYGFEITSTNAHNIYLQFFSTSGVVVGLAYLLFIALVFKSGIVYLLNASIQKNEKLKFAGIFFAWLVYLLQGIISIDNISLAIWGWFLGGVVFSLANQNSVSSYPIKQETIRILRSSVFVLPAIIFCSFLARAEIDMLNQMKVSSIENTAENRTYFRDLISKVSSNPLSDQSYKRKSAERLFDATETEESLKILNSLVLQHPNSPENYYSRSTVYAKLGRPDLAIQDQEILLELDPWNAINMFKLGENYKTLNDYTKMSIMREKILALTGDSEISNLANEKLQLP